MGWKPVLGAACAALIASSAWAQNIDELSLVSAAQDCRADEAAQLLRRGVSVNATNPAGYTALMMAAGNGCTAVVRLLIDHEADLAIAHPDFGTAAAQAKMHGHVAIESMLSPAPAAAVQETAAQGTQVQSAPLPSSQIPAAGGESASGASRWPSLGAYREGQEVLFSGTAGKTWSRGMIKSIDPTYGYNIDGWTGSYDAFFVVGTQREPFWTGYFVGDWRVSVPMAMGAVTDGNYLYRTVSGGMRLPPLRISADGSYSWRVQEGRGERLIRGSWDPNPHGPGVILKNGEKGADWLVYNNSRTGSELGETVILSSECCTHHDGSRLRGR